MRYLCLSITLAVGVGCFHFPFTDKGDAKPAAVQRSPVLPEQVKETTAHKVAEELDEEVTIAETTSAKPEEKKPEKK